MRIALVIDNYERANFFSRFADTHYAIFHRISNETLRQVKSIDLIIATFYFFASGAYRDTKLQKSLEWVKGEKLKAVIKYLFGYIAIHASRPENLNYCIIWNGSQAFSAGVQTYCKQNLIQLRFLELGNIPGKIFVDNLGVNAASSIYVEDKHIRRGDLTEAQRRDWIVKYVHDESVNKVPLQVKTPSHVLSQIETFSLSEIILKPYIFVPLQVSSDTQLLLNSDYDNLSLLQKVLKNESYKKFNIVIKFHPGDDPDEIWRVYSAISMHERVLISQEAVIPLILNSEHVVTINSTVGLQSLLLSKPTTFLGRTIYSKFSTNDAHDFVNFHLRNLDYFSSKPLTRDEINEILFLE